MYRGFIHFFAFLEKKYPGQIALNELSRQDILDFIVYCDKAATEVKRKDANPNHFVRTNLFQLKVFLEYLERYEWKEAPTSPVSKLLFPDDIPRQIRRSGVKKN
ncbi:hypothetical protein P4V60_30135 [Brevibacillus porteri]|uniref:hypothetical protein n=1 Tax=Brevibacillus porteri TaxID=2126350 RepID=UPI002E23CC8E|nr:hypothetical protein [Brevibacillus porteri]